VTTSTEFDFDAVMATLEKLRRLAERGGTLHEAEVAAQKMSALLLKHNLTPVDVQMHAERHNRTVQHDTFDLDSAAWKRDLMFVVARGHLCRAVCMRPGGRRNRLVVFGHAHNLIVTREMYLWLERELRRLADAAHRHAVASGDGHAEHQPRAWKHAFRVGGVHGIWSAYDRARREAAESVDAARWALVPLLETEVEAARDAYFSWIGNARNARASIAGPYHQGRAAGESINVGDRQVGHPGAG
jgi:hypothetical protein